MSTDTTRSGSTRFVIVASPRTGSNYLCGGLNAHPDVLCHYELFHPDQVYCTWELTAELGDLEARNADPKAFLAKMWGLAGTSRAVGFKIFAEHDATARELTLADASVKKIVLRRRNRIKTYVSELVAGRTGVYQRLAKFEGPPAPPPRVHVDPRTLRHEVARREQFYSDVEDRLRRTDQAFLPVYYEDLVTRAETRAGILQFLGVAENPNLFKPRDLKQNPDDLRLLIENFDELARALAGDELAKELRPGR